MRLSAVRQAAFAAAGALAMYGACSLTAQSTGITIGGRCMTWVTNIVPADARAGYVPPGPPDTAFGVRLGAFSDDPVTGSLDVLEEPGDRVWVVHFSALPMSRRGIGPFESAPLFIDFPKPIHAVAAFVTTVVPNDGSALVCPVLPATNLASQSAQPDTAFKDEQVILGAPPRYIEQADPVSSTFSKPANCTTPYLPVRAVPGSFEPALNSVTAGDNGTATAELAIGADGKLLFEYIAQSSGTEHVDKAVLEAARLARYSPAMLNCRPVAGWYLFRAPFHP